MIIVNFLVLVAYFFLLGSLMVGWKNIFKQKEVSASKQVFITILVPVRNEGENISLLLNDLVQQDYTDFEIIVIDDHSEDDTGLIVKGLNSPIIKYITNQGHGKKQALTTGVSASRGNIIVTTDGDCRVGVHWLKSINNFFSDNDTMMLIGGVSISAFGNLLNKMQQIEFASLIGTTASTLGLQHPTMCNGANLAFRKQAFQEVNGYQGNEQIASGDDEFLMRKIVSRYKNGVKFLTSKHSVVSTQPQPNLASLLQQRLRWAGKWRFNSSYVTLTLAFFIVVVQIITFYSYVELIFSTSLIYFFLIVMKVGLEAWLLKRYCNFLEIKWNWIAFLCLQLIYPLYVL